MSLKMRTSTSQFQVLVEYMQKHGDLSKPNDGPNGKATNLRLWAELTNLLNADATGDTKSTEKWRKVWSDLKNNTKKKAARIYKSGKGTGGGPACPLKLSDIEERVLAIIGTRAATGIIEIPEVGLQEEVTELTLPTLDQTTDDSPSIFVLHERFGQETCSNVEDWNRPGTSRQPTVVPPLLMDRNNNPEFAGREEPEIIYSPDRSEGDMTQAEVPTSQSARIAAGGRRHAPQSPTPLPPTPRRRRTRPIPTLSSPAHRRTRTQTQSDLARQAFVRSDSQWRNFQIEAERERNRLRELEIRMQERWLDLFSQFLILGNRIVDTWEKQ